VPRGRNTPRCRPRESVQSNRLFWRTSQSSSTVAARLTSAAARPLPPVRIFETFNIYKDAAFRPRYRLLEQEIALRQRQHRRRLARQKLAVGAHFVGVRIDFHLRQVAVVDQVALAHLPDVLDGAQVLGQAETFLDAGLTPKKAGFHTTRSAHLPGSMLPTSWLMPCEIAGLIVYLAT